MLTLLPILAQVLLIVVWALFLIMAGAPLGASPVLNRVEPGSKPETAGPAPMGRRRPSGPRRGPGRRGVG